MVKAAIVEDETSYAEELSSFFKRYMITNNHSFQVTIFTTADKFLANYKVGEFDIIFMDIEMPSTNGMEAAKILRKKGLGGYFVFRHQSFPVRFRKL